MFPCNSGFARNFVPSGETTSAIKRDGAIACGLAREQNDLSMRSLANRTTGHRPGRGER
jgi:hypothetical protein